MDFDTQQQILAEQLRRYQGQSQFQAPQGRMVGRVYVAPNPLEYLAAGLRSAGGMAGESMSANQLKELAAERQKVQQNDMQSFVKALRGTPEQTIQPATPNDDEGNPMPTATIPAQPGSPEAAYGVLAGSAIPQLRQMGTQGLTQLPEIEARRAEREADRLARQQMLQQQIQARQEQAELQRQFQKELKAMGGASAQPYFQPVQTAQGVMAFNARTGRMEPVQINGQGVIGAQYDPALQGQLTASKESAKSGVEIGVEKQKAVKKADQMIAQLNQAEELLKQKPTASGIGAVIDTAARAVGATSKGAQTAGQIEALSGWLVANVPRMEGPQSNFDVQNYQTMAGKIGDRTVPVAERQAALQEVKRLQEKYKSINQDVAMPAAPTPAQGKVRRFNPATGMIE